VPFREESCRSSCIYSGPLHIYSRDAVSQHPSTRAGPGAESIQLVYSGRALQALSDLARQFRCHPIFGGNFWYSAAIANWDSQETVKLKVNASLPDVTFLVEPEQRGLGTPKARAIITSETISLLNQYMC